MEEKDGRLDTGNQIGKLGVNGTPKFSHLDYPGGIT